MKEKQMKALIVGLFLITSVFCDKAVSKEKKSSAENSVSAKIVKEATSETGLFGLVVSSEGSVIFKKVDDIPNSFPQFTVPGFEEKMDCLRELFFLHYPDADPKSTLWDSWLPLATLWPAVQQGKGVDAMRQQWRQILLNRRIDAEGYVSTHQHVGLAHSEGWPFPLWSQAKGIGWHFSMKEMPYAGEEFGIKRTTDTTKWLLNGIRSIGFNEKGWQLKLTKAGASLTTPAFNVDVNVAPFIRIEWQADGIEADACPYMEWTTTKETQFNAQRRIYFSPVSKSDGMICTNIATYKLANWKGRITGLRVNFDNSSQAKITIKSLITAVDSRHNINNFAYLQGCDTYLNWTGDLSFLRENIIRMRLALRYAMDEFDTYKNRCVVTPWVGHDGRPGFEVGPDGKKTFHFGRGIGNNYYDLLPFGGRDCFATIYYFDALNRFARLERQIAKHPEWNIPGSPLRFAPDKLERHAREVKEYAGKLFWNPETGRFVSAIDIDGKSYDYGFVFLNCEAIYYGFATDQQARSILDWLSGKRIVASDTSQGKDIYHWRFAARSTTKYNLEYYVWTWRTPEIIPWGGQVEDGGAVLGFSYHDMMARLTINGPDDAWQRLREIINWFDEVKRAGGYRKYYEDGKRGTLQGAWTAGGLGMDAEFFESALVPQVMIYGFMGFEPRIDGFAVKPQLPKVWPKLTISRIRMHRLTLDVTVTSKTIEIHIDGNQPQVLSVYPPPGQWHIEYLDNKNNVLKKLQINIGQSGIPLRHSGSSVLRLRYL
jgi:hypothetical protein